MRYLAPVVAQALETARQMVFLAGPRQVGKTTLGQSLLREAGCEGLYFNWDIDAHRRAIAKDPAGFFRAQLPARATGKRPRLLLDEIHKYPRWKRLLKGFFDEHAGTLEIMVTGSGRLDIYQRGGDSLFGRYDLYHLHPFTSGEHAADGRQSIATPDEWLRTVLDGPTGPRAKIALESFEAIERFSGFPEPLFAATEGRLRKWRKAHRELIVRQDLRDLTRIRELGLIESLLLLLPERVGSPLSLQGLATELGVAYGSVKTWLEALERLYFLFELRPYAGKLARALRREGKVYLFDATEIEEDGPRFENVVALHLIKLCDFWTDCGFGDFSLHYLRDKEKREVDFIILADRKPWLLIETKLSDEQLSPALRYFHERLKPKQGSVQLVRNASRARSLKHEHIYVVPAAWLLAET